MKQLLLFPSLASAVLPVASVLREIRTAASFTLSDPSTSCGDLLEPPAEVKGGRRWPSDTACRQRGRTRCSAVSPAWISGRDRQVPLDWLADVPGGSVQTDQVSLGESPRCIDIFMQGQSHCDGLLCERVGGKHA